MMVTVSIKFGPNEATHIVKSRTGKVVIRPARIIEGRRANDGRRTWIGQVWVSGQDRWRILFSQATWDQAIDWLRGAE